MYASILYYFFMILMQYYYDYKLMYSMVTPFVLPLLCMYILIIIWVSVCTVLWCVLSLYYMHTDWILHLLWLVYFFLSTFTFTNYVCEIYYLFPTSKQIFLLKMLIEIYSYSMYARLCIQNTNMSSVIFFFGDGKITFQQNSFLFCRAVEGGMRYEIFVMDT